jgi:hypothetical protein
MELSEKMSSIYSYNLLGFRESNDRDESRGLFLHPKSQIALVIVLERQNSQAVQ